MSGWFSWSRWLGIVGKEFIQLKRDRLTFGMIVGIPVIQLVLFGYAINSDPKHLPTAALIADSSEFSRSILAGLRNSQYFEFIGEAASEAAVVEISSTNPNLTLARRSRTYVEAPAVDVATTATLLVPMAVRLGKWKINISAGTMNTPPPSPNNAPSIPAPKPVIASPA